MTTLDPPITQADIDERTVFARRRRREEKRWQIMTRTD